MTRGLWVSPTEFVSFEQQSKTAAGGLTGQIATRLAAGDISSFMGLLPNPDPVLKAMGKDIKVYRNLLADPLVMGARGRRAAAVLSMERGFDATLSKRTPVRVMKAVEAVFAGLDLQRIVRDLIDGAFFGYRVGELMWEPRGGLMALRDVIAKPCEWFGFDPDDARLMFRPWNSFQGVDVPARKFVVVGKMRNWENPYGEPDLAAVFWAVTFKRSGMKFWVTFTEKYGMPWAVGKLPRQAGQNETDDLANKLEAMVRDAVAVVPDDSSVELLQTGGTTSADMYEKLLMFCRSEISVALLGNNQSVEMQANKASATAAKGVEASLRDADAQMVAAGLNAIARDVTEVNFPGTPPPVYAFWEQEEVDEVQAGRDQKLKNAGVRFTNNYWKRTYNLEDADLMPEAPLPTDPETGDDAVSFADPSADEVPADQLALDAAIEQLPADAIQSAMKKLLAPALKAIEMASTPDEVREALVDAWPDMDVTDLEELMTRAYFVADLVGRDAVTREAAQP